MKLHKDSSLKSIHVPALMLVIVGLVSGCSGSSNPVVSTVVSDTQSSIDTTASEVSNSSDNNESNGNLDTTEAELDTDVASSEIMEDEVDENVTSNPNVTDPLIQNTILVNFDITVPVYKSDELLVGLTWGDSATNAAWVGDEYWSTSLDLATDTESLLMVTFFDRNGGLELGSYETQLRTGTNASESVVIEANQFDTERWDADGDGVSNLGELIAGNDPLLDEDSLLPINDSISVHFMSSVNDLMSAFEAFESRLSEERPFLEIYEPDPEWVDFQGSVSGSTDIDAEGNGTVTYHYSLSLDSLNFNGTRTNSGSSINWEGSRSTYDGDFVHKQVFSNTVTVLDDDKHSFVETIDGSYSGTYTDGWDVNSDLTGVLIEGTSYCKPIAGTVSKIFGTGRYGGESRTTTISKEIDDLYWKVVVFQQSHESQTSSVREYFVRELNMDGSDSPNFKCNFVDF